MKAHSLVSMLGIPVALLVVGLFVLPLWLSLWRFALFGIS